MSFVETPRFPETIASGSKFGPGYNTSIARNLGGYEQNNQNWLMPLYEGDVSMGVKDQDGLDQLLAFFHGVAGRHNSFRFKNFNDYTAAGAEGTVVSLTASTFQLYKTYTYGALTKARKITKPVNGTLVISGGGSYTVDYTTGIITKVSGSNPTGWSGEFDTPVRFDVDQMLPQWMSFELYTWQAIPIKEIRL